MALTQITEKGIKDGEILNADVNASAAIAGSKINPDFGSQGITTTGVASIGNGLTLTGTNPYIDIVDSNNNDDFTIKNDNGTFKIQDKTDTADRFNIDSSGRMGIGLTPSSDTGYMLQLGSGGSQTFMTFATSGSGVGATNGLIVGNDTARAYFTQRENQPIFIATNNIDRVAIDENGNVGIGTTSPSNLLHVKGSGHDKVLVESTGTNHAVGMQITHASGNAAEQVWQLQTNSGASTQKDLSVRDATAGSFIATFRKGGGITFNGDTAAANALDDYEEGQWAPNVATGTISYSNAYYTKVGRLVTIQAKLESFSNASSSSGVAIGNLPFTGGVTDVAVGSVMYTYVSEAHATVTYLNSSSQLEIYGGSSGNWAAVQHSELNSSGNTTMFFIATYQTT